MNMCRPAALALVLISSIKLVHAESFHETLDVFRQAGESAEFFQRSYGYAVFPTIGAGAIGIGGAYGKGRVYVHDQFVGTTTLKQLSLGVQLGGKSYSQIIFFEDKRALDEFESGTFEFGANASVIAITAGANAQAATNGVEAGVSQGQHDAQTRGNFQVGMAVFVVAKGGLFVSASVAGEKFSFEPSSVEPTSD